MNIGAVIIDAIILIGTGYVVFFLGNSGWWFLLAVFLLGGIGTYYKR